MADARPALIAASLLLALPACGDDAPVDTSDNALPPAGELVPLAPTQQAARVSLALRGVRPTLDELQQVEADPASLETLVDQWLQSDDFGRTLRDMHAEQLLLRNDLIDPLPSMGPLAGESSWDMQASLTDEPLRLVEHIVMNDLGYDQIVTSDVMLADDRVARVYGLPYDEDGPEWQLSHWTDGRPLAGILSSSAVWNRYRSGPTNHQRQRAAFVSDALLCEPLALREVELTGGEGIGDPEASAEAVWSDPACVACHQALDPMGAVFWGFRGQIRSPEVVEAYNAQCLGEAIPLAYDIPPEPLRDLCYPVRFYQHEKEDWWHDYDLRAPGFYGTPIDDLADLGDQIAQDPRFATCTARRFWSWFAHVDRGDIDHALVDELATVLRDSDFDAKALARAAVLHPRFLADHEQGVDNSWRAVGALHIRPEQYADTLARITGFDWWIDPPEGCGNVCWQEADLGRSDRWGFRALAGGVDSSYILEPSRQALPTTALVQRRMAAEAAATVVAHDQSATEPLLFDGPLTDTDEVAVRARLVPLHARITSELVDANSPEVDRSYALWSAAHELSGDPVRAWELTVAALLQDPHMVLY